MITVKQNLYMYSEKAVDDFVQQSIGKPLTDVEGKLIGTVVSAERISGARVVELKIEPDESYPPNYVGYNFKEEGGLI